MLFQETKHEMFEKLKSIWADSHKRVHDFKQKRLMKFPQIYYLNYNIIYDHSRNLFEYKSHVVSKYTFNLENDMELDLGGNLFMRDNLGLGTVFSNFRFYLFGGKLFNSLSTSFGEKKGITYETNYLINDKTLIDYIYKRKFLLDERKHKMTLYRTVDKNTKYSTGITFVDYPNEFSVDLI
jgi:hypothetical protein